MTNSCSGNGGMRYARRFLPAVILAAVLAGAVIAPATAGIGVGTVVANPYDTLSILGGTLVDNTISNLGRYAVIQLGPTAGAEGSTAQIDFQGIDIDAASTLTIRSGAPGQSILIRNIDAAPTLIAGALRTKAAAGFAAPVLYVSGPTGITVQPTGAIDSPAGLTLDALGGTATSGEPLVNNGVLNGGNALWLFAANVTGSGLFSGDSVYVSTYGNANNPVNGAHYLANGLQVYPGTGSDVLLTLNDYGSSPQVFNFNINGNGTVAMPSAWPAGSPLPQNNLPVPPEASTAGPPPAYGGGSMIIQATGTLTLSPDAPDFVFPGGIVFKSGGTLDLSGVIVDNGWTGAGVAMQGVFFEAPSIISAGGDIQVFTNNFNWVNFSTFPQAPVRTWQLAALSNGQYVYSSADDVVPHINSYSTISEAAAAGQCWTCLVNSTPMNSATPPPPSLVRRVRGRSTRPATPPAPRRSTRVLVQPHLRHQARRVLWRVDWDGRHCGVRRQRRRSGRSSRPTLAAVCTIA